MRWVLLVALGCYRSGTAASDDAGGLDAAMFSDGSSGQDGDIDCVPTHLGSGSAICGLATLGTVIEPSTVSTDSCVPMDIAGGPACLLAGADVTIESLRATGSKPLVIAARGDIHITSVLDVSSDGADPGPGVNLVGCGEPVLPAQVGGIGGGGAGGTFQGSGGAGGGGGSGSATGGMATTPLGEPTSLVAGCGGQAGASATSPAAGGSPGGIVYLVAGGTIDLESGSRIDATGQPGSGGTVNSGGGGGGAGGLIVLDANAVVVDGQASIVAPGGGGGGGGGGGASAMQIPGCTAGVGGPPGGGAGGEGGACVNDTVDGVSPPDAVGAGGGGGGGAGWIVTWTHSSSSLSAGVRPAATAHRF